MKVDQCQHCTVRGDLKACKVTPCNQHDSWYAVTMQAKIAALEKDAVLYGFLKDATWNIENFSRPGAPDVQWSVSFYSNYGALPHEEDPSKASAAAMKGGA